MSAVLRSSGGTVIPFPAPPGQLVTVDPGKRRCGVALWVDGVLAWAGLVEARQRRGAWTAAATARAVYNAVRARGEGGAVWVVEDQQNYPGQGARTRDLDSLRAVVQALRMQAGSLSVVRPSEWKGSVPKKVHHVRIAALLSGVELSRLTATDADTLDAVALGLWALGRTGRGGARRPAGAS